MNWKRTAAALLCLVFCFVAGCQSQTEGAEQPEDNLIIIGLSQIGAESDWRVANSESMKAVFTEANGYRLLFDDARQIQENQIMAIRKFIQQQVDYIVLMPLSETGWDSVLQEARDADIPVILVDRMVDVEDESLYTAHVGSDFYRQGERAVEWMEEQYGDWEETVEIVHIQGTPGSTAQIGRTAALETAVAAHADWRVLTRLDGDFTQAKANEVMRRYLEEMPRGTDIDLVYCENDNEAFGVIEALESYGYVCGKDVDVLCFDATRRALALCMEGKIALAVECNPLLGPLAEGIVSMLEAGQTPAKRHYIEEVSFTPDTVSEALIARREY